MYTPNSDTVFVQAYAGAMAGIAVSSDHPSNPSPAAYLKATQVSLAWAEAVDTAYGVTYGEAAPDGLQAPTIQSWSERYWAVNSPYPVTPAMLDPATWAKFATACIAALQESESTFSSAGITPPPWGGGGGGTVTSVTGTAPVTSTGGTTPAIRITPASDVAAGSMSAADKTKLDGLPGGVRTSISNATSPIPPGRVNVVRLDTGAAGTSTGTIDANPQDGDMLYAGTFGVQTNEAKLNPNGNSIQDPYNGGIVAGEVGMGPNAWASAIFRFDGPSNTWEQVG